MQFLSFVAGQIALAMDHALNFQRLNLLLDLTNRVVSKLDLRELLREISASIRRVMQCDGVGVALSDPETGQLRLYAFDHPGEKGIAHEGDIISAEESKTLFRAFQTGVGHQNSVPTKKQQLDASPGGLSGYDVR